MKQATHTCPLCSLRFDGAECHGSCPMAAGCSMIRCPRCFYEFVEDGFVAGLLRRWLTPAGTADERMSR
jgi:hypothetical protein